MCIDINLCSNLTLNLELWSGDCGENFLTCPDGVTCCTDKDYTCCPMPSAQTGTGCCPIKNVGLNPLDG